MITNAFAPFYICIAIFWPRRRPDHVTSTEVSYIIQPYRQPYHKNTNTLASFFCYAFFFKKRPVYLCNDFLHIFHWLIRRTRGGISQYSRFKFIFAFMLAHALHMKICGTIACLRFSQERKNILETNSESKIIKYACNNHFDIT